jgi:hypothetical protein
MLVPDRELHAHSLLDLSDENFQILVDNNLGNEAPTELWDILLHPLVARRTFTFLNNRFRDVEDQLAERRAGMESLQQECFSFGPDGKQAYFAAKGEHEEWRRRALGYRRVLGARLREAKAVLYRAEHLPVKRTKPNPPNPARKIRQMDTVFRLAWAIHEHQQRSHGEDIRPEPHDVALWEALNEIEVETSTGQVTVADFLADISSKPGFIPPSERDREVS